MLGLAEQLFPCFKILLKEKKKNSFQAFEHMSYIYNQRF